MTAALFGLLAATANAAAPLVISDAVETRIGTLTAGREWFKPWRTSSGEQLATPSRLRDFIVFEDDGSGAFAGASSLRQCVAAYVAPYSAANGPMSRSQAVRDSA